MKFLFLKLQRLARVRSWVELRRMFGLVFYDVEAMRRELELMAMGLIGETVKIILRHPAIKNFSGHAYIDSRGVRVIDISPMITAAGVDEFYFVILHEICHHERHIKAEDKRPPIIETMYEEAGGAFFELDAESQAAYESDPQEAEANSFAQQLDCIAEKNALSSFGNAEIKTRIRVLKNMTIQKGEFEK